MSLMVLALVLLFAFAGVFYADGLVKKSVTQLHDLEIKAERILTNDLRSTTAVRLAASLQSDRYVLNYQDFQDAKYTLLEEIAGFQKTAKVRDALSQMEDIQSEIEDAEAEAISLIDEEEWESALELVTEPSFRRLKGIYRANLSSALREMILTSESQAAQADLISTAMQYFVLGMFILLALIGVLHAREMQQALAVQSELAENLEDANVNLEQKVRERTAEVEEKEAQLRTAMDNMTDGIYMFDSDLNYMMFNDRYVELFGIPKELVGIGKSGMDILRFHAEQGDYGTGDVDTLVAERRKVLLSGETRTVELALANGRILQLRQSPTAEGGAVVVASDVTEAVNSQRAARLLQEALDNFSDMVILYDKEERVVFTNDRYHEIFPHAPAKHEITNHTMESLLRDSLERGVVTDELALSDPEAWLQARLDDRRNNPEGVGETKHDSGRTYLSRHRHTTEGGVIFVQTDITDRIEAEAALKEGEERLQLVLKGGDLGLWDVNLNTQESVTNQRWAETLGYTPDDVINSQTLWRETIHPDDLDRVLEVGRKYRDGDLEEYEVEYRVITKQGDTNWLLTKGAAVEYDADGKMSRMVGTVMDISARKKAEEELREARDAAEAATKAKASFLATMSHEIRTPMGGVIGMVDILRQTKLDDDQRQMIGTVRDSAYALLTIINDILDFSKIEAGKLDLEEIPISIRDAVEGVGEALAVNARNKNISLCVYADPELPDAVMGDQVRLRQILFNLGGNAVKFTEKGKVLIRADKLPSDDEGLVKVRLQVIDDGIGIPEEAQANLFQAFSQVDESTTRRFGGTGLGLSICQRLTELMGGTIEVSSVEGEGSTFASTITFPLAEEHDFKSDGHDLNDLNVLHVVEDEDLRELVPRYLRHWGAEVHTEKALADAMPRALQAADDGNPFDVIVLGSAWGMEEKIDLVERLQVESRLAGTKYVINCRGRARAERKPLDNAVYVDADPMQRAAFIRGVAVAAGRASPEVEYDEGDLVGEAGEVPTPDEAEAIGQLILLAEDNPTNQNVIGRQLGILGYAVEIADDGREALERMKTRDYAILLTDCHMPNMDGFELVKTIRESESEDGPRLPVVAITASVMKEEIDNCFASGMDDYLPKPLEMDKLRDMLRKWMPEPKAGRRKPVAPVETEETAAAAETAGGDRGNGPIDPSALKNVFGDDDEVFKEILNDFVGPATANAEEIAAAVSSKSAGDVGAAAHKLKSSSRSVGANELADICETLEQAGKQGDWDVINASAERLPGIMREVVAHIGAL